MQVFVPSLALSPNTATVFCLGCQTGPFARSNPFVLIVSKLGWCRASRDTILRPP